LPTEAFASVVRQGEVDAVPIGTPLSRNCTLAIAPVALIASPVIVTSIGPSIVEHAAGLVMTMIGAAPTTMSTAAVVLTAPRSSVAFALIEWMPAVAAVHDSRYGADRITPSDATPSRNSTLAIVPSESVAVASSTTGSPARTKLPAIGVTNFTLGG